MEVRGPLSRTLALLASGLFGACGEPPARAANSAGEQVYGRLCINCHRAEGHGAIGEVPPLIGHFPEVVAAGGRRYVIRAVLYGLEGPVEVGGKPYAGLMTPMSYMKDEDLAAVLNHVASSWGNQERLPKEFTLFTPTEIAAERNLKLKPRQVMEQRPEALRGKKGTS